MEDADDANLRSRRIRSVNDNKRQPRNNPFARSPDRCFAAHFRKCGKTLDASNREAILRKVRDFADFAPSNDPYEEHDFVSVEHNDERYFAKIDYYALDLAHGSEDPADPAKTVRVLTLMRADEY